MRSTMFARGGFARRLALTTAASAVAIVAMTARVNAQPKSGSSAQPATPVAAGAGASATPTPATGETPAAAPVATNEDVPVNIRLRQLEQRVQALKERAWRAKARVEMLKEAVLGGGGLASRAGITHQNKMGNSYRLIQLVYSLDGQTIFTRKDDTGKLHDSKKIDVLNGPLTPGSHTISVLAVYRGHGYGVFKYLKKFRFTVRASHTFTVEEGRGVNLKVVGYEKGGGSTPLQDRPAIDFQADGAKE